METSEAMYDPLRTTLDRDFLLHHDDIEDVSLTNILTNDNNDDDLLQDSRLKTQKSDNQQL